MNTWSPLYGRTGNLPRGDVPSVERGGPSASAVSLSSIGVCCVNGIYTSFCATLDPLGFLALLRVGVLIVGSIVPSPSAIGRANAQ